MHKILILLVFAVLLFTAENLFAQSESTGVVIIQDEKIDKLEDYYTRLNARNPEIDGYRVQIYQESGSYSKSKSTNVKETFQDKYPGVKAYLIFKEPYYIVRIGNFRTLDEAYGFKKEISEDYPNAYPVSDKVLYKDL